MRAEVCRIPAEVFLRSSTGAQVCVYGQIQYGGPGAPTVFTRKYISKQPTCLKSRNLLSIKNDHVLSGMQSDSSMFFLTNHGMFFSAHAVDHRFL